MPAAAAIAIGVVAAGTAGYQSYNASQAKSEAIDEKGRQEKLAEKAQMEAQAQADTQKKQQSDAIAQADTLDAANAMRLMQQRRRNSMSNGTSYNKGGTLLTGPQGLSNTPQLKTLLGA